MSPAERIQRENKTSTFPVNRLPGSGFETLPGNLKRKNKPQKLKARS
jgi:hypothetical protein